MTNNVETFTTRIFLNDSEAKDKLAQLSKDVEKFRKATELEKIRSQH